MNIATLVRGQICIFLFDGKTGLYKVACTKFKADLVRDLKTSLCELAYDIHKEHGSTRSPWHSSKQQYVFLKSMILFSKDCVHAVFGKCLLRFGRRRTTSNVILLYKNINCKNFSLQEAFFSMP